MTVKGARDCDANTAFGIAVVVVRWGSVPKKSSTLMYESEKRLLLGGRLLDPRGQCPAKPSR